MAKTSMTTLTLAINDQQAKKVLENLKAQMESVKKTLEETQEKFKGERAWDIGDTAEKINKQIKELKKELKSLASAYDQGITQMNGIDEKLKDISKASYNQLTKDRTTLSNTLKGLKLDSKENLKTYEETMQRLQKIRDEIAKRDLDVRGSMSEQKAREVLSKPQDFSVDQIQKALSVMQQYNKVQIESTSEWAESNKLINEGTLYLDKFSERIKKLQMEELHLKLYEAKPSISDSDLNALIKYWETMSAGADKGTKELQYYNDMLEEGRALLQQRSKDKAGAVMSDPSAYSVNEINEAIEATKKLQAAQQPGSDAWRHYGEEIKNAKKILDQFNQDEKESAMKLQLNRPSSLSTKALSEQKKYWQEMVNGADTMNPKLIEYKNNLQQVIEEERSRARTSAEGIASKVNADAWNGTIGQTKEAYEQLKKYRDLYEKDIDKDEIESIDQAMDALKQKAKEAEQGFISMQDAIDKASHVESFNGSIEDLEKLKQRLLEIKNTEIRLGGPDTEQEINNINKALDAVDKKLDEVKNGAFDLEKVLKNPKGATFEELERAAEQLKKELKQCAENTDEFVEKSAALRQVDKQLDSIKKQWKEQDDIITKTAKLLASYILVYAGWNEIWGKMKEVFSANIELSDSLADIQKTTGLSADSVAHLSDQINSIDTRTAQKELHDLAYEAGKLGISAEEDVLAFVRAGNQLIVALGEELGGAEAVRSLMKVNAVLGETQELGVEKALLSTGSAINEISQTSRASAGPIADMVSRIGAIGAAANLGMADLVALAGTADALAQSAEISGTAFNKFIATLQTNTVDVAYALGMDPGRLKSLMDSGNTIQAIIEIFERMNLKGNMSQLAPIMGELGSEGTRMTQVLTTLAGGVEELKSQVFTSNQAFRDAVSVTNEYNIKNEDAAAIMHRMGNNMREMVVNSGFVKFLEDVLRWLYYLPNALERSRALLFAVRLIMVEIATVSGVKLVPIIGKSLVSAWNNLSKSVKLYNAVAARSVLGYQYAMLIRTASGAQKATIAFRTLAMAIKSNPIFFIGSVIAAVGTAVWHFAENTNKAAKAAAEYGEAVRKEQFELDNLKIRIDRANKSNGERTALIKELNNKYGQYLGFLVTENNYVKNQDYIYKLLNKQIERSIALKMQEKLVSDISSKYADKQIDAYEDMNKALLNIKGIGERGARDAMIRLMDSIKRQAQTGSKDVTEAIHSLLMKTSKEYEDGIADLESMRKNYKWSNEKYLSEQIKLQNASLSGGGRELRKAISDMFDIEASIAEEANKAADLTNDNIKALDNQVKEIKQAEVETILKRIGTTTDTNNLKEYQSKISDFMRLRQTEIRELMAKQTEQNDLTEEEQRLFEGVNQKIRENQELTDEEQRKYNALLEQKAEVLGLTKEEVKQLQNVNKEVGKYKQGLDDVEGKLAAAGSLNLWGDGKTIKDMDVNQLVAKYKQLQSDGAKIGTNAAKEIQTAYWKGFSDQKKAIAWYYGEAKKIKDELESRGYNTSGKFKWGGEGSDSDNKRKAKEEMQAAIAAFEAYWNEYDTYIKDKAEKEKWTAQELNRQILDMDEKRERERVELYKAMLGETNAFNQEMYVGMITGYDYFAGKNLDQLAAQLAKYGIAMEDGLRNTMTKAMLRQEEYALTLRTRIEKLLLEDNFTEQVAQKYLDAIDELGLLFGLNDEEATVEVGRRRISIMQEWAKESYLITAKELEDKMRLNTEFAQWVQDHNKEDYEALLIQLRKFNDDLVEADKKTAERRKKIADAKFDMSGQKTEGESRIQKAESKFELGKQMETFGVGGEQVVNDLEIEVLKEKIAYEQQWLALLAQESRLKQKQLQDEIEAKETLLANEANLSEREKLNNELVSLRQRLASEQNQYTLASTEAINNMLDYQKQATGIYTQQLTWYFDHLKEYQGQIDTFAQSMGEGVFGSKEDRQQAAKDLLSSVLTTSKNVLQIWLTQLATRRLVDEMEVKQTEATEMRKRAIKLQSMIEDGTYAITGLTIDAAKAEASTLLSSAEATGKEVAKKGLIGLAVGAAISAALSALLGLALGKVNQAKSEIASATGARGGRLSTGMLTYAEGNYPVLGNDGKVYDAKYEGAGMKTGIYRGGAHFGIFSEKKPEAIIDGDTTQRLIMNHPEIWKAIVTLSRTGKLERGMRTFASGNIEQLAKQMEDSVSPTAATASVDMIQMQSTLDRNSQVMAQLVQVLAGGIKANINMYGEDGMYKNLKKAEKFASVRKYK